VYRNTREREKREARLQVVISAYVAEEPVKGASHVYKIPTDVLRYAGGKMTR
jgi:hypothetical protein